MEENREPLSAIAIEKKLQLLRNKHFSEDTIALVKSDYEIWTDRGGNQPLSQ